MSETYADLGGGSVRVSDQCLRGRRHRYDPTSGYCAGCGRRDDGHIGDGTPAARAARGPAGAQRKESA